MKKQYFLFVSFCVILILYNPRRISAQVEWTSTTNDHRWITQEIKFSDLNNLIINATIIPEVKEQAINGFGVCFNELGWTALSVLDEKQRENILNNIFDPEEGLKLNLCRMPIGANDYAREYYSLNDSVNDFEMKVLMLQVSMYKMK